MSHNIQKLDRVVSLQKEWHNLQEIVEEINFATSGLDWPVERRELFIPCNGTVCPVDGWQAIVRGDKNHTLSIQKGSYTIIQNSRLWEALENSLVGVNHKIVSAGSIANCRKIFISVELSDAQDYVVNRQAYKNYLTFISSHDGSTGAEFFDSSVKIVCGNTFNWSRRDKGLLNLKVFHTKNSETKIQNAEAEIEQLLEKRQEFYTTIEWLASRPMTTEQANKILTGFLAKDEVSTRTENTVDEIVQLFQSGRGNSGQTMEDLWSGFTEYYTHFCSKDDAKRFASNQFGTANDKKLEFFDALLSDAELNQLAARGDALLKARQQAVVIA
jgi:phage/plasmid-like protein (TIGR03299 family)